MKIIFILDSFASTEVNKFLLEEVLFLRGQDIDARILTLTKEDSSNTLYSEFVFTKEGFTLIPVVGWWKFGELKNLKLHLEKELPDFVITCGKKADSIGRIMARITRVPNIFVFVHDVAEIKERKKSYENIVSLFTDYFIVSSEMAGNMLISQGVSRKKITVLPDGVSFEKYGKPSLQDIRQEMGVGAGEFVFIFLGEITSENGVDVLLRAFAKVSDGRLLIVGDGVEKKNMEELAKHLDLQDRAIFLNSHTDIPGLLFTCNAMIFPSKAETITTPLLLGLLSELPIIATDFQGTEEFVKNKKNGLIVRRQDSEELAGAIRIFLSDKELYEKLKKNTKNNLFKYSLSSHAAKLLALAGKKRPKKKNIHFNET